MRQGWKAFLIRHFHNHVRCRRMTTTTKILYQYPLPISASCTLAKHSGSRSHATPSNVIMQMAYCKTTIALTRDNNMDIRFDMDIDIARHRHGHGHGHGHGHRHEHGDRH